LEKLEKLENWKPIRHVPNALSALRIFLSLYLPFAAGRPWLFTAVYLVVGLTDVFDGRIARRFHVTSALGSKLDAVGDSALFGAGMVSLFFLADLRIAAAKCLVTISFGVAYKLANVAVTRVRFGEWNMMHTLLNRFVFVVLYFLVPVFLLLGEINYWLVLGVTAAICLACFEETATLLRMEEYDVNNKGLLGERVSSKLSQRKERSA
jgi:CDP-diacylglycerol--glycerol-3-phosphate 3-phosphatidyltransferase